RAAGDSERPEPLGLQAPGAEDAAPEALAGARLGEGDRARAAGAAEGALAAVLRRPRAAPRAALVHPDGPTRLAARAAGLAVPRRAQGRRPDAGAVLGRLARPRGRVDGRR